MLVEYNTLAGNTRQFFWDLLALGTRPATPCHQKSEENVSGKKKASAGEIDELIGSQIRIARSMRGQSMEELGAKIDRTYQQVQKYEKGTNRVSASMLWRIANLLDFPISFFYEGVSAGRSRSRIQVISLRAAHRLDRIKEPPVREAIVRLIDDLSSDRKPAP